MKKIKKYSAGLIFGFIGAIIGMICSTLLIVMMDLSVMFVNWDTTNAFSISKMLVVGLFSATTIRIILLLTIILGIIFTFTPNKED